MGQTSELGLFLPLVEEFPAVAFQTSNEPSRENVGTADHLVLKY